MQIFRSMHLQKHLGLVQEAASKEPVLFANRGRPSAVMMSVEEFKRLKQVAGEPLPPEVMWPRPVTREGLPRDPLGYDTTDLRAAARQMAADVRSGRNKAEVQAEIERVERRLGMRA